MTLPRPLFSKPIRTVPPPPLPSSFNKTAKLSPNLNWISGFSPHAFKFIVSMAASSRHGVSSDPQHSSSQLIPSNVDSDSSSFQNSPSEVEAVEEYLDKVIYRFRFMAFLGVLGSLIGSFLCFIKGCTYVVQSFMEYSVNRSKVIWSLVEAIDVYLLGTVMLVFGMGLYELFISNLDIVKSSQENKPTDRSNLLGMFMLKTRSKRWWLLNCSSFPMTSIGEGGGYLLPYQIVHLSVVAIQLKFLLFIQISPVVRASGTTKMVRYNNCERAENEAWPCYSDATSNWVVREE
ncbi:unnamed protein product [Prunus armeniaca]|uniref:Uncharacterized protein n=1 Tax=Prunus armeniaca TaxID=36596 RepID=A0A6J5X9Z6_PRUAR|nr:unnamed protein product [Prunus armeniaca]